MKKLPLQEIGDKIAGLIKEQFFILRKDDPYEQTVDELTKIFYSIFTQSIAYLTHPEQRSRIMDEDFYIHVANLEHHFKEAIKLANEAEGRTCTTH